MTNVQSGDLAFVVVPAGFKPLLAGKFVTVNLHGRDDMHPNCTPVDASRYPRKLWFCVFHVPFQHEGRTIRGTYLLDAWLRPIRNPGADARDEMLRPLPQPVEA